MHRPQSRARYRVSLMLAGRAGDIAVHSSTSFTSPATWATVRARQSARADARMVKRYLGGIVLAAKDAILTQKSEEPSAARRRPDRR